MDKDVLVRFIQFLENVFSRINSKRLMTLYAYLLFLLYSKEMTDTAVVYGTAVTLVTLGLFMIRAPKEDAKL